MTFICSTYSGAYDGKLLAVADEDRRVSFIRTDKDNTVVNGNDLDRPFSVHYFFSLMWLLLASYHHTFYTHDNAVLDVKWSHDDALLVSVSQRVRGHCMQKRLTLCPADWLSRSTGSNVGYRDAIMCGHA